MECPGGPLSDLQAGSSSAEDEARLLQGYEPAWRLSGPVVRLPRLYVSSEKGGLAWWSLRHLLPAGGESKGAEGNPADDPTVGVTPSDRQSPGGSGTDVPIRTSKAGSTTTATSTSRHLYLDSAAHRCLPDPLGPQQVQAASRQRPKGARDWLARVVRANPTLVCPLAPSACQRPNIGSRMSREVSRTVLGARGGEIPPRDSPGGDQYCRPEALALACRRSARSRARHSGSEPPRY